MISKVKTSVWDCVDLQMILLLIHRGFFWFFKVSKKIKEVLHIIKFLIPNFELERKYMPCNKRNQKLLFWLVIPFFSKIIKKLIESNPPPLYAHTSKQFVFNLCERNNLKE